MTGYYDNFPLWTWIAVGIFIIGILAMYRNLKRSVLLNGFAAANDATYNRRLEYDGRSGVLFGYGHSKRFQDLISRIDGSLEVGNYYCVVGYGRHRRTYLRGFVRIKMPRRLPNMVLDAKKNNAFGISNLPAWVSGNQTLHLEGDFDKYFTLYAPKDYQIDALTIFTPDVMQELISLVSHYDLEVIDDYIYIYSTVGFNFSKRQLIEIDGLAAKLGEEFSHQSSTYMDDRVEQRTVNAVGEQGVRLRRQASWRVVVVAVISVLAVLAGIVLGSMEK